MSHRNSTRKPSLTDRWPWLETAAFVVPLFAHMCVKQFTDLFFDPNQPNVEAYAYPVSVAAQVMVGVLMLVCFGKIWLTHFRFRISILAVVVGVVGYIAWVAICHFQPERSLLSLFGMQDFWMSRPGFNPFEEISSDLRRNVFLAMRFTTLALVVPVAEELFLRGFLVRWIQDVDLKSVRFDQLGWPAIVAPTVCSVLTHPEILAAIVWFSLVTWLMIRTKSFWNCVVAHITTNLLLGIHVVLTGSWSLW